VCKGIGMVEAGVALVGVVSHPPLSLAGWQATRSTPRKSKQRKE
jgi:hypothetical protein